MFYNRIINKFTMLFINLSFLMESFFQPIVGAYEEVEEYEHLEYESGEIIADADSNYIQPAVAFFWYGLSAHVAAIGPFIFYLMFYRQIEGIPDANSSEAAE